MITTTFLLLLLAFEVWYLTSKQTKQTLTSSYAIKIKTNEKPAKFFAGALIILATVLMVYTLGVASGIVAMVVGLMAAGSLIVVLQPFQYVRMPVLFGFYILCLLLEFYI